MPVQLPLAEPLPKPSLTMHIMYNDECAIWRALKFLDGNVRHPSGITFSVATINDLFVNGYFKTSCPTAFCIDASVQKPPVVAEDCLPSDPVPLSSLTSSNSSSSANSMLCSSLSPPTLKRSAADAELSNVKRTADLKSVFSDSDDDSDPSTSTTTAATMPTDDDGGGGDSAAGSR